MDCDNVEREGVWIVICGEIDGMWIVICGERGYVDCDNVEMEGVWIVIMWRGRVCGL